MEPQCQFFITRKKRLCRMTVRSGREYCGEHEPKPIIDNGQEDTRIPCPNDPKHTCYASKLQKHLSICNARIHEEPEFIQRGINAPSTVGLCKRKPLNKYSTEKIFKVIDKINNLFEEHLSGMIENFPEQPIHAAVLEDFNTVGRTESSLRHLRQASSIMHLVEKQGLVKNRNCYVEFGAGKGQLSWYACQAWCNSSNGSSVLLIDRASLRHKKDNKLRSQPGICHRVRADLAHLVLAKAPGVVFSQRVIGLAKHLCGVATDYALRCAVGGAESKTDGLVIATCCHHRCEVDAYVGELADLGIDAEEFNIMLGVVSWATCGDGRARTKGKPTDSETIAEEDNQHNESQHSQHDTFENTPSDEPNACHIQRIDLVMKYKEMIGRRAKALLDLGRVLYLRKCGFQARLCYYVPRTVSLEHICIVATKIKY